MPYQLHQIIVIRILSLVVSHIADKRCILFDVPGDINSPFDMMIIILRVNVCFERAFPHGVF